MNSAFANKRVAIYARYSSALQNERSIEDQVHRCAEHVRAGGGDVNDDLIFADLAISAGSLQRPGFEMMMRAVDEKRVDAIVAEDLSRISRDLADSATLFKRLQYAGVPLIGVADGVDTGGRAAKLTFTVKSLVADLYIDDLRDKTRRGLLGRSRAGYSTGGLPFGYRTESAVAQDGHELGRRIVVDDDAAATVRRVFDLYLSGHSYGAIAKVFNIEGVPFARLKTKHRRKGWVASSVRAILHNPAYIGEWSYNKRERRKVPGTNVRRPRARDVSEVIVQTYPERQIIPFEIWERARQRAAAVRARYKGGRKAGSAPGAKTNYALSGLLFCGVCGAAMTIMSGTTASYYSCGDARKRGTCGNRRGVREDAVRVAVMAGIHDALFTPDAIARLRKQIAEKLRLVLQTGQAELDEHAQRLRRTEDRIRGLVAFIGAGDDSRYVRETLRDLEAQALADETAIGALKSAMSTPVKLPGPDELLERARHLDRVLALDPLRAREVLRAVFVDGRIEMHPLPGGSYIARANFLPLVAVNGAGSGAEATTLPLEIPLPRPPDRRLKKTT